MTISVPAKPEQSMKKSASGLLKSYSQKNLSAMLDEMSDDDDTPISAARVRIADVEAGDDLLRTHSLTDLKGAGGG